MKMLVLLTAALFILSGMSTGFADPPGLSDKGGADFPKGLEKNEKTPHGWTQGQKKGWKHKHHHHHHKNHHKHDMDQNHR